MTVEEIIKQLSPEELNTFWREASDAASFQGLPGTDPALLVTQRRLLFDGVTAKYADHIRARAERRDTWKWIAIIVLALALVAGWMARHGVHGCNDPDVVLGGCSSE